MRYIISGLEKACPICGRFPPDSEYKDRVLKIGFPEFGDVPLQNLVDEHFSRKITEQENGRRCSNCCHHDASVEHDKRLCKQKPFSTTEYVTRHPQYLILQLLRFRQTPEGIRKINANISDVSNINIQETQYELISILNHEGTLENGHYTALLKSDSWYLCNDISNIRVNDENIESSKNYVFLFKKKEAVIPEQVRHEWIPTNEYQDVPPGNYAMPAGLEYILDMQTGRRQAQLPQKKNNSVNDSNANLVINKSPF